MNGLGAFGACLLSVALAVGCGRTPYPEAPVATESDARADALILRLATALANENLDYAAQHELKEMGAAASASLRRSLVAENQYTRMAAVYAITYRGAVDTDCVDLVAQLCDKQFEGPDAHVCLRGFGDVGRRALERAAATHR